MERSFKYALNKCEETSFYYVFITTSHVIMLKKKKKSYELLVKIK